MEPQQPNAPEDNPATPTDVPPAPPQLYQTVAESGNSSGQSCGYFALGCMGTVIINSLFISAAVFGGSSASIIVIIITLGLDIYYAVKFARTRQRYITYGIIAALCTYLLIGGACALSGPL